LLASRFVTSAKNSFIGELFFGAKSKTSNQRKPSIEFESSEFLSRDSLNEYASLQLRVFRMTLVVSVFVAVLTIIFVDFYSTISLLIGAFSGIIYLRLLAKSIGSLGTESSSVSKFQLLVPVLLVLVVVRLPELHLLPALVGFLLYKPSLIIQFLIEPSA